MKTPRPKTSVDVKDCRILVTKKKKNITCIYLLVFIIIIGIIHSNVDDEIEHIFKKPFRVTDSRVVALRGETLLEINANTG